MRWLKRNWLLLAFVAVNIVIAAPAGAVQWDDDVCDNGQGEGEPCCTTCYIFCNCTIE